MISLGVNDDASADTIDNLRQLRGALTVGSVVWLLPGLKENVRAAIRTVAAERGDQLVDTRPQAGPDHLHPTGQGYRVIAAATLNPGAGPDTEVAFDPVPPSRAARTRLAEDPGRPRTYEPPPVAGMGGNLSRYRLHVVFRDKLQHMADLRLQLAHQQAGLMRSSSTATSYAALPPPSLAYAAFAPPAMNLGPGLTTGPELTTGPGRITPGMTAR